LPNWFDRIEPGRGGDQIPERFGTDKRNVTTVDTIMDLVRNLVPENVVQACIEKVETVLRYPGPTSGNATILENDKSTWRFEEKWTSGTNVIGLTLASLVCSTQPHTIQSKS